MLYNAFLCRDFVAPNVALQPSTEPNLMKRDGCATCHLKLEPMAAYFARVAESDWTWLPDDQVPVRNPLCKGRSDGGAPGGACTALYDPAFQSPDAGTLRGAYPDVTAPLADAPARADQGPAGLARWLIESDEFAGCAVRTVAAGFLGRQLDTDDAKLEQELETTFVSSGYRTRALLRALLLSDAYLHSNNLSSSAWRDGGR